MVLVIEQPYEGNPARLLRAPRCLNFSVRSEQIGFSTLREFKF